MIGSVWPYYVMDRIIKVRLQLEKKSVYTYVYDLCRHYRFYRYIILYALITLSLIVLARDARINITLHDIAYAAFEIVHCIFCTYTLPSSIKTNISTSGWFKRRIMWRFNSNIFSNLLGKSHVHSNSFCLFSVIRPLWFNFNIDCRRFFCFSYCQKKKQLMNKMNFEKVKSKDI